MSPSSRVRFGIFEFDLTTFELRRDGMPINLQSQPAKVLATLLEHAGDVVTRETLQSAVWQSDTHVDFERGLNFCIAQIRSALGDSAESPKFLRTIPKRGYQFIAPLERIAPIAPQVAAAPLIPAAPAKPRSTWPIAVVIVLILSSVFIYGFYRRNAEPAGRPPIRVAVALFDNETGNPELDQFATGLTDQVVAELTMSGLNRFDVIGNASVLRVPREQRDLNTIASTLQSSFVILGQVQRSQDRIRVLAHLIRMPDQAHVWVARTDRTLVDPLRLQFDVAQFIRDQFTDRVDLSAPPLSK